MLVMLHTPMLRSKAAHGAVVANTGVETEEAV